MAGQDTNSGISARLIADDGEAWELNGEQVLGRSEQDDITIPNKKVSRGHARFNFSADGRLTVDTQIHQQRLRSQFLELRPDELCLLAFGIEGCKNCYGLRHHQLLRDSGKVKAANSAAVAATARSMGSRSVDDPVLIEQRDAEDRSQLHEA